MPLWIIMNERMNRTGYSELPGKKWEWKHCEVLRMEIGHEKSVQWKMESVGWNMKEMKELQEVSNRHFWKMEMWKWKMNENKWKGRECMEIGMETIEL
jgi:hypothetical protein